MNKPLLILIAGGTCAGKSTLAIKIRDCFPKGNVSIISSDEYQFSFKNFNREKYEKSGVDTIIRSERKFPTPQNLDWSKLLNEVKKEIKSNKIIFVEGLHALQNEELRNMADLKIYSHTDDDIRLILKINRSPWFKKMVGERPHDPRNFGGTSFPLPFALKSWWNGTRISEMKHIFPTQKYADLVLNYNEMLDLPKNTNLLSVLIDLYFKDPVRFQVIKQELKSGQKIEKLLANDFEKCKLERNSDSTYDLIKQISQKKGRKIKVIADWDDCLQPVKVMAVHQEANPKLSIPFKQFFDNYWENVTVGPGGTLGRVHNEEEFDYLGNEEEKKAAEDFERIRTERQNNKKLFIGSFYESKERFEAPFTSTAEEIVRALKEDLISELVIMTAFREDPNEDPEVQKFLTKEVRMKKEKINRTFEQFPQFRLEYTKVETYMGRGKPHRWEIIQKNHPDFDLMINDSPSQITSTWERLGKDKHYAVNDYLHSRYLQAPDIYHVKTTLSDIKDEDIIQAAAEYRKKFGYRPWQEEQRDKDNNQRERERERAKLYWMVGGGVAILLLGILATVIWRNKRRKKKTKRN